MRRKVISRLIVIENAITVAIVRKGEVRRSASRRRTRQQQGELMRECNVHTIEVTVRGIS
jgi:hypothetical protein